MALGTCVSTNNQGGCFIFGDAATLATHTLCSNPANNQFMVRSAGGATFYTKSNLTTGIQYPL